MLPFENAKLLPKSKVFEEQVASRTKEAGRHDRQKPQKAQHKNQFYTGACQSKYTAHLLDPTADRYSGEPQVLGPALGKSETVHDFEVCHRTAKEAPIFWGCFVGDHDDEIHIG